MTEQSGRFTAMFHYLARIIRAAMPGELDESFSDYEKIADRMRMPRQWIRCDHCGAFGWRMPPHGVESCPIVLEMSQSAGLKMDAERSSAIRAGLQMEGMLKVLQEQFKIGEEGEE